jgi:branched-chain amino acid transport system ATP-binding protein
VSEGIFTLENVEAGYGYSGLVLKGVSLSVSPGQVVCVVGPNGAGKSTVLKVASGMLEPRSGSIQLNGRDISGLPSHKLLEMGLAHILQDRSLFPEMTVGENVQMGGYTIRDKDLLAERIDNVRSIFPVIGDRWAMRAGLLSGGQQKMVELGRAMVLDPDVMLLDEPSMGLDPKSTAVIFEQIDALRRLGKAILLVEQNARRALQLSDIGCVLDLGVIRLSGRASDLLKDPKLAALYLGGGYEDGGDQQP